jgi:hypothetical protein
MVGTTVNRRHEAGPSRLFSIDSDSEYEKDWVDDDLELINGDVVDLTGNRLTEIRPVDPILPPPASPSTPSYIANVEKSSSSFPLKAHLQLVDASYQVLDLTADITRVYYSPTRNDIVLCFTDALSGEIFKYFFSLTYI